MNPISGKTVSYYEFGENESAFAICSVVFESANDPEPYIVVGTAVNLNLRSGSHRGGKIHVFRLTDSRTLILHHSTTVDDLPLAMAPYGGKILVSVGSKIRLYDLGKKVIAKMPKP